MNKRLSLVWAFVAMIASIAPASVSAADPQPGVSVLRPEYAAPGPGSGEEKAASGPATLHELRELIRAQSEAIRALTSKIDTLEERLRRIEVKLR